MLSQWVKARIQAVANRLGYRISRLSIQDEHKRGMTADWQAHGMSPESIKDMVGSQDFWWHTITLPFGIKTPGRVPESTQDWITRAIPNSLKGQTVLDVGAWDGYYSFLAERRGASSVLAIDNGLNRVSSGLPIAKTLLRSNVEYLMMDVENIESLNRHFDVVLFFGVYYHLKNPLLAIERLGRVTNRLLILEGHFVQSDDQPMMRFYPNDELGADGSNWWGANESCLVSMLHVAGFNKVAVVGKSALQPGLDSRDSAEVTGRILITAEK